MQQFLVLVIPLFGIVGAVYGAGVVDVVQVFDVEEIVDGKGLFNAMKVVAIGTNNTTGQAVSRLRAALEVAATLDSAYANFTAKYGKPSSGQGSKETFKGTVVSVFQHNLNAKSGLETFTMGINFFSDLTLDQVRALYTGSAGPNTTRQDLFEPSTPIRTPSGIRRRSTRAAPTFKNWVAEGHVTPVKMQFQCGSCMDFAATGALESMMSISKGVKGLDLSEQELLDCPTTGGVWRCRGNFPPEEIYNYLKSNGLTTEAQYKYEAKEGSCRVAGKSKVAKVTGYYRPIPRDESMLKEWISTYGVHSAVIEINAGFQNYKSGVMSQTCSNTRWDHSVLIVGYGTENNQDYWLVKNSWDTNWGDGGYIKMARNKGSLCRIADYTVIPWVL